MGIQVNMIYRARSEKSEHHLMPPYKEIHAGRGIYDAQKCCLGQRGQQKGAHANTHADPKGGIRREHECRVAGHVDALIRRGHA